MLAKIISGATVGLEAVPIEVEVDVAARGMVSLTMVGLPDKAVQEAKDRVRTALQNAGCDFPSRRITINLAPADLPKQGPAYDLPIALGILLAAEDLKTDLSDCLIFGELSLDGSLRHTNGALPLTLMAKERGYRRVFLPQVNAKEAAIVSGIDIYPITSLQALLDHLKGLTAIQPEPAISVHELLSHSLALIDMNDVHGQEQAKRACEIAAAGGHNLFLTGVPGAGKTMLSRAFAGILPHLTEAEALEVTKIYSIAGLLPREQSIISQRPFRSPHHTVSLVGMIGGGSFPKPGEISLAHRGVLFLDEFPEFPRNVLESLRAPLEDGRVQISRAAQTNTYPCRFTLIAAANPCPCGNLGSQTHPCTCSAFQINNYKKRISGPILDRIDLHVHVPAVDVAKLAQTKPTGETSISVRQRVQQARDRQLKRFAQTSLTCNADMSTKHIKHFTPLGEAQALFLNKATQRMGLSARSYFKTIKVARTIADLADSTQVETDHLAEALQYRPQQRVEGQ